MIYYSTSNPFCFPFSWTVILLCLTDNPEQITYVKTGKKGGAGCNMSRTIEHNNPEVPR